MSIIGMCLSDLLTMDYQRSIGWLQVILEPYLMKLDELAQLKQTDKVTQSMTCHMLNLLSQFMSSLIQRQQSHANNDLIATNSTGSSFQDMNNSFTGGAAGASSSGNMSEKAIVNSILIKLMPIYKQIITRNLPTDCVIIDKLFESVSVILTSNISTSTNSIAAEVNEIDVIFNNLVEMLYCLNEESWRRYAYEVSRQVINLI